ncbi:MAG: hypothetical protein ACHP7O_08435 [Burkholderiales bacterium]
MTVSPSKARWQAIELTGHAGFSGPLMYADILRKNQYENRQDDFVKQVSEIEGALRDDDAIHAVPLEEKLKCLKIGATGDLNKARSCFDDFYARATTALYITFAHRPAIAWEVYAHPYKLKGDGFASLSAAENKALSDFMLAHMIFVEFANLVEGELAGKLTRTTMRDPTDAKRKIQQSLFEMPVDKLHAASEQALSIAVQNEKQGFSIPPKTTAPEFSAGSSYYLFDKAGGSITKSGVPWFSGNEGKINGKKYELALESSISASSSKKKSGDQAVTVKGSTSEKAGTEIK